MWIWIRARDREFEDVVGLQMVLQFCDQLAAFTGGKSQLVFVETATIETSPRLQQQA